MKEIFILSPLSQFEVTSLIGINIPLFGYFNIALTNLALYTCFILLIVLGLHLYGNNESNLIPNKWSISFESSFASLSSMVREQIGSHNEVYLPFIYSLFFFILVGNLISNVPYSFAVTASGVVSLGLSFTIFIGVTILAFYIHGIKILSTYLYQLFTGSIIVAVITFIPFVIFLALIGLELAVSLIQAFVFTLLVCSYLKDAIELH